MEDPFRQGGLEGAVDGFLGHPDGRQVVAGDGVRGLDRRLKQVGRRHHSGHDTRSPRFCGICGIKSFYRPRSHPDGYSVNFRCLDAEDFRSVLTTEFDGRNWEQHIGDLAPLPDEG